MIQDIFPEHLDNAYRDCFPEGEDPILTYDQDCVTVRVSEGRLVFPTWREFSGFPRCIYAFSAANQNFFLIPNASFPVPDGYERFTLRQLRDMGLNGNLDLLIAFTGFHLWKWYTTSQFCGTCGQRTVFANDERAMICPACGNRIYPRINPAVIVGVIDGDRLLITRYQSGFRHNALIAGFAEIGETAEQCVIREVMEETGLRVKHIRYYKSQPWGIASDLLMGFYCEVDGSTEIHRDDRELSYAEWVQRENIQLQPTDYSLTNEMMRQFRDGVGTPDGTDNSP